MKNLNEIKTRVTHEVALEIEVGFDPPLTMEGEHRKFAISSVIMRATYDANEGGWRGYFELGEDLTQPKMREVYMGRNILANGKGLGMLMPPTYGRPVFLGKDRERLQAARDSVRARFINAVMEYTTSQVVRYS